MLRALFRKLFGNAPQPASDDKSAAHHAVSKPSSKAKTPKSNTAASDSKSKQASKDGSKATSGATASAEGSKSQSVHGPSRKKSAARLLPIDLDIGFDLGTSCTKAVVGDREANRQTAVPLNLGRDLRGYLLPTRVYLDGEGVYSLEASPRSVVKRDLKMRIMESAAKGRTADDAALCEIAAFAALTIRRVLDWYQRELARDHQDREPVWHLNIGLPSRGGQHDIFAPIYRRIMRAAVCMAPGNDPITHKLVEGLVTSGAPENSWLPDSRLNTFPESGAQLASLIMSPHRPSGCMLVVDVGAGTMDISTLRVGGAVNAPTCTLHVCDVAPLGVHYLYLARRGLLSKNQLTPEILARIPDDDGISPAMVRERQSGAPVEFVNRCRNSILPVVSRYRQRLKKAHQSKAFRPWVDGLPYVLSGGGHRDPFYQTLLGTNLEQWLCNVVSEWHLTLPVGPRRGLMMQSFPTPRSFAPKNLLTDFDRFSVAHGLSLGADGLMEMREAS